MKIVVLYFLMASLSAYAHGGGVDEHGCHSKKEVRHCHGANVGKYIPENEPSRIKKLHGKTCSTPDGEGRYPNRDLYGKRCNAR